MKLYVQCWAPALVPCLVAGFAHAQGVPAAEFEKLRDALTVQFNAVATARNATTLLERRDLSTEQRIVALFQRAGGWANTAFNVPGAIKDWEEVLKIAPPGHWSIQPATERIQENRAHFSRLEIQSTSSNVKEKFAALLDLGRHDDAAKLFREQTSTEEGTKAFESFDPISFGGFRGPIHIMWMLGYLCEGPGYSGQNYQWSLNAEVHPVQWCDSK